MIDVAALSEAERQAWIEALVAYDYTEVWIAMVKTWWPQKVKKVRRATKAIR